MMRVLSLLTVLVVSLVLSIGAALAQDASPTAGACVAPELPPGTPTPMEEAAASPAAEGDGDGEREDGPLPGATGTGSQADEATAAAAIAAMENLVACINAGDFLAVAALVTQGFIEDFIGVPTVYDVPATFEGVGQVDVLRLDDVQVYEDGAVGVRFVYGGFFSGPTSVTAEYWVLVQEDGIYKLANVISISLPADVLPGAVVVEVTMVDFAFHVEPQTIPAGQPVIFRVATQDSAAATGHVAVLVTYPDGTTAEQVILGEVAALDESTGFLGAIFLEPGETGDMAFTSLDAGTYFLVCDVETDAGHLHYDLGMVTQITVE